MRQDVFPLGPVRLLRLRSSRRRLAAARPAPANRYRRRYVLTVEAAARLQAGFPLLPTEDHPHWTVVLSEPTREQFARVRPLFNGPFENPAWTGRRSR